MTAHDYANLRFLLNSPKEVLKEWYETVSEDDLKYAFALLTVAKMEIIDHEVEIAPECPEAMQVIDAVINTVRNKP